MAREPIISNSNPSDDDENQPQLRPQRLSEMVGQREVIEVLRIAIDAALKRGEALGH
ncbi:MAG: Holliday junction branch migration DNA helicase RuvB, partial [Planctomycetales bacterium]|nr:Holliday junction branch migration DNA helicase RuvB [Planctomycetales bacterium]